MDLSQYLAGASATPPSAPASPSAGYPTGGNPATGVGATTPGAYWFYQLQAEIATLLAAAGLSPSQSSLGQLLAAIRTVAWTDPDLTATPTAPNAALGTRGTRIATMESFATECPATLATPGQQRMPSGLIVKWGTVTAQAGGTAVTFDVAFPTAGLHVVCGGGNSNGVGINAGTATTTGFVAYADTTGSHVGRWIAIGY